jgi:copper chaperone CopZ
MKQITVALAAALLSLAGLAGCERQGAGGAEQAKVAPAVAAPAPAPAPTMVAAATAPAAAEGEKMSCGNAEMADGTCAGEGGEAKGCSQWDEKAAKVGKRATPGDAVWTTIPVTGMSCGGCERRIIANLGEVDGVLGVEADAELGQVRVAYARGNDQIAGTARSRIQTLGYKVN